MTRLLRHLLILEVMLPAVIFAVWLGLAWSRSAHLAILTRNVPIRMLDQNGDWINATLPSGRTFIVRVGWDGVYRIRHWIPMQGYETVALPADAIEWAP